MTHDLAWAPCGTQTGHHKYAPPPWMMFDALVDERDKWLLRALEVYPKVSGSRKRITQKLIRRVLDEELAG